MKPYYSLIFAGCYVFFSLCFATALAMNAYFESLTGCVFSAAGMATAAFSAHEHFTSANGRTSILRLRVCFWAWLHSITSARHQIARDALDARLISFLPNDREWRGDKPQQKQEHFPH